MAWCLVALKLTIYVCSQGLEFSIFFDSLSLWILPINYISLDSISACDNPNLSINYIWVHAALMYMLTAATEPTLGKKDTHLVVFLI